ncbi:MULTISPECIES: ABC transporter substrate-binding protein [unclassified Microbacterium]|uniref:ABC transporter substrate-binding protein n=1 Tax=unclassified Microbacterium TaxID=2609290 RepID=UPI00049330D2|nr:MULTISPECIES: ABC transporter substrate-binding protein [unclassified Microbacterium]
MLQRSAPAAAVGIVAVLALTACSTSDEPTNTGSTGDQKTLTIATDNVAPLEAVVEEFEAAHPDITVEIQDGGSDYPTFLRTGLAAGTAADVIRTFPGAGNVVSVVPLDEASQLVDLSGAEWAGELSPTQNNLFSNDDKLLSVPIGALGLGPVYNDQTMEELGLEIPETYSEVLDLCAAAKDNGKVAYTMFLKGGSSIPSYAMLAPLLYGPNPDFTVEQIAGDQSFADSEWVDAFAMQQEMLAAGCFNEGPTGTEWNVSFEQVATGQALATFAFSDTTSLEDVAPEGTTFSIAPFPVDESGDNYLAAADSSGFGINAKSDNQDAAKVFIDFLATADAQNAYATASKGAPSLPNDSFSPDSPNQATVLEYVVSGKTATWPDQGWPGTATQLELNEVSQTVILGSDSPEAAAERLDAAFAKDLADK